MKEHLVVRYQCLYFKYLYATC